MRTRGIWRCQSRRDVRHVDGVLTLFDASDEKGPTDRERGIVDRVALERLEQSFGWRPSRQRLALDRGRNNRAAFGVTGGQAEQREMDVAGWSRISALYSWRSTTASGAARKCCRTSSRLIVRGGSLGGGVNR